MLFLKKKIKSNCFILKNAMSQQNQNIQNNYGNTKSQLKNEVPKDNKSNITPDSLTNPKSIEQEDESKTTNSNLVNNSAEKNKNSYDENVYGKNKNEYTNSTEMDLLRETLNAVLKTNSNIDKHTEKLQDNLKQVKLDDTYKQEIENSKKKKKDFAPVKKYKGFFDEDIKNLIEFIFDHSDEKFTISITDYDKFTKLLGETVKNLQEDLDKKNDKGEYEIGNPLRSFIVKTKKALNSIDDNNGFSFNPTNLVSDLSHMETSMSCMRNNISILRKILITFYNFIRMTNSYQNIEEIKSNLKSAVDDINSYYECDLKQRPMIVTRIFDKIARIEYLLERTPFIPEKDIKLLKSIKKALEKSLETRLDSNDIIISFIKVFGKDALKHICEKKISNKKAYNRILNSITKYIKNNSNIKNEQEVSTIAEGLLNGQEIDDIRIKNIEKKYLKDTFFYGKVKKEYDNTIDDMENAESYEDAIIKGNDNLRKIDAISKQTKTIIESFCNFVNACNQEIEEFIKACTMYDSLGGKISKDFVNSNIIKMRERMLNSMKTIMHNYRDSFYEYIEDSSERKKVIRDKKKEFEETKEKIEDAMQKKLYKDGKPKTGKESDILETKNILSNMKEPCAFSFACYEQIEKMVDDIEQPKTYYEFKNVYPDSYYNDIENGNMFALAEKNNRVANEILKKLVLEKKAFSKDRE